MRRLRLPRRSLRNAACALSLLLAATVAAPAWADCQRTYTSQELVADLSVMTVALRDADKNTLTTTGGRMEVGLACIRTKVPAQVFANAYRFIGASYFMRGDEEKARSWFRSFLELSPTYEWDVGEVPLDHPLRRVLDEEREGAAAEPVRLEGKALNVPAGSSLLLDGRKLTQPEATLNRLHLLQVIADSDSSVRQAFLVSGNALPEQYLRSADQVAVAAASGDKKTDKANHQPNYDLSVVKVQRVRPAAKTPLMLSGAVIALGAAGIYGASFATHGKFEAASTTADLEKYQRLTNTLVIASGSTLLVGLGVEYAGIMLGGHGPGFTLRGRF